MPIVAKQAIAMLLMAATLAPVDVHTRTLSPVSTGPYSETAKPAGGPAQLTGKERLGEKWKDEQRIDNCKVPPEKRGTKPRPDSCAHAPTG